jgi:SAM-dependent methyltransferase
VSRYWWASRQLSGKRVLDCACGKGYGSYILSHEALSVHGIDLNTKSLEIARASFQKTGLSFSPFDVLTLDTFPEPLDAIVAFEVIEHLPPAETDRFLSGIARKLAPGGFLLLSTPNHDVVSKSGVFVPEFHINNFPAASLRQTLERHFGNVEMLGQYRRRPWPQHLAFSLDFWNLRHVFAKAFRGPAQELATSSPPIVSNLSSQKTEIARYLETCPPEVHSYEFSPAHWRQAGLTVARCRVPRAS